MMSCRCSRTSFCSFASSARVGGPSEALASFPSCPFCAHAGAASCAISSALRTPHQIGLDLFSMVRLAMRSFACLVNQHQRRREDVVLDLGNATVLPIVEILELQNDPIGEVDVDAAGGAPPLGQVSAVGASRRVRITKPDERVAIFDTANHAEVRSQIAVQLDIAAAVELQTVDVVGRIARGGALQVLRLEVDARQVQLEVNPPEPHLANVVG